MRKLLSLVILGPPTSWVYIMVALTWGSLPPHPPAVGLTQSPWTCCCCWGRNLPWRIEKLLFHSREKGRPARGGEYSCWTGQLPLFFLSSLSFPLIATFWDVCVYRARQGTYWGLLGVAGKRPSKLSPIPWKSSNLLAGHLHLPEVLLCAQSGRGEMASVKWRTLLERKSDVFRVALRAGKELMGESLVRHVPINAGVQWAVKYWGYKDKTHTLCSQGAQTRAGEMNA